MSDQNWREYVLPDGDHLPNDLLAELDRLKAERECPKDCKQRNGESRKMGVCDMCKRKESLADNYTPPDNSKDKE